MINKPNAWKMLPIVSTDPSRDMDEAVSTLLSCVEYQGIQETMDQATMITTAWQVYFLPEDVTPDFVESLKKQIAAENLPLSVENLVHVPREDWHDNWRQYFKAIDLTKRIRIVPEWEKGSSDSSKLEIAILPGMAFGTGTHATTQLCMMAMDRLFPQMNLQGTTLLDIGCGTAILAMLGVKLGVEKAVAFDIDPDYLENAQDNLALNDVSEKNVRLLVCELSDVAPEPYDFIICNMLSREFKPVLPFFKNYARPGTLLILSGLLTAELAEIRDLVIQAGFSPTETTELDEWSCIVARA